MCVCVYVMFVWIDRFIVYLSISGDENRITLMGLGAVEPLSRLISHEDKSVRRNAFMALGIMASNGKANTI